MLTLAILSLAADCDSTDIFGVAIVPDSDATAPTVGLELRQEEGGAVIHTAPYTGALVPVRGRWLLVSTAGDTESGIRAMELFRSITTTVCPTGERCRAPVTNTVRLPESWVAVKAQTGDRVNRSGVAGATIDEEALLPAEPAEGGYVTVQVDLYAIASNHLDGQAMTPPITLSYSVGTHEPLPPPCDSFVLQWAWPRDDDERTPVFVKTPSCPRGTGAVVTDVKLMLQFDPGVWPDQTVTVSHGGVNEIAIRNGQSSSAFNGLDPAGEWRVEWGGNVIIHPVGLTLVVRTG